MLTARAYHFIRRSLFAIRQKSPQDTVGLVKGE